MSYYSPSIEKLIEAFEKLPSIGNKTAARLAFHILDASEEETNEFITAIQDAKKNLKYCSQCFNITDTDPCPICGNQNRDHSVICVVEDVRDVVAMERTHEFKGVYHVLHGSISPMNGVGPDDIKLKETMSILCSELGIYVTNTNSDYPQVGYRNKVDTILANYIVSLGLDSYSNRII